MIAIGKAENDIAITDGVHFVYVVLETFLVEFLEEFTKHLHDYVGLILVLFGKGCEAFDVGVEHCALLELVGQL